MQRKSAIEIAEKTEAGDALVNIVGELEEGVHTLAKQNNEVSAPSFLDNVSSTSRLCA